MPTPLTGILLDIDGTLIDSNDANTRAWMEAMQAHGLDVNYIKIREAVGMGGDNLLPRVAHLEKDSPQGKAISKTRGDILKQKYLPTLRAFPQVKELLTRLHSDGLKLVVATSAKLAEAKPLLALTGAAELIDVFATSEDAESSKPASSVSAAAAGAHPISKAQSPFTTLPPTCWPIMAIGFTVLELDKPSPVIGSSARTPYIHMTYWSPSGTSPCQFSILPTHR